MTSPATSRRRARPRFDSPEQDVFLGLWRTYDRLKAIEDEFFDGWDLTGQQYNVLRLLDLASAPLPTLEIASRLVSRAPDITRMLDKLEARGWIVRERLAGDRRQVHVSLTPAGHELLAELAQPLRECHERQLGHLTRTELKALSVLLRAARRIHEPDSSPWR
ncbi:MAG: MarR family transcriptional regulator [Planctomyces sp.]|nr:MarR family transcriptional regulator [Planctomyces sp.]